MSTLNTNKVQSLAGAASLSLVGGDQTTSQLILQSTAGVGTTGADIILKVGNAGATEAMRILNSGYVGIGTSVPTVPLQVETAFEWYSVLAQLSHNASSPNYSVGSLILTRSRGTTIGSKTKVESGDYLGWIGFSGADGANYIGGAAIYAVVDGATGTNDIPGKLIFATTADGAATTTDRMVIDKSGNVGIGTASPNTKLELQTTSDATDDAISLYRAGNGSGYGVKLPFFLNNSSNARTEYGFVSGCVTTNTAGSESGYIVIYTRTTGSLTEKMRITSAGNVGIGTDSPSSKLEVVGGAEFNGVNASSYIIEAQGTAVSGGFQQYGNNVQIISYRATFGELGGTGNRAVYSDAGGILTNSSSDERLKTNISPLSYGLSEVLLMSPISFNWKEEEVEDEITKIKTQIKSHLGEQREIGFTAQSIQNIIPEVVGVNNDGTLSLDYNKLSAVLVNAIKELNITIEAQNKRIEDLITDVDNLKKVKP